MGYEEELPVILTSMREYTHTQFMVVVNLTYLSNRNLNIRKAVKYGVNSFYGIFGTGEEKPSDYKAMCETIYFMLGALIGVDVIGISWPL